jgi:hypothetical protein
MSECSECVELMAKHEKATAELDDALVWRSLMLMRGKPGERLDAERRLAAAQELVQSLHRALEAHQSDHRS